MTAVDAFVGSGRLSRAIPHALARNGSPAAARRPLLLVFWCQILIVLVLARAGGYLLRLLGQPRVIGELLAGVLIGPSVLGQVWADGFDWLFPPSQRQAGLLLGLAWIGIVFLLGITGADVDVSMIRHRGRAATTATFGSLMVPLAFGALVAAALPET